MARLATKGRIGLPGIIFDPHDAVVRVTVGAVVALCGHVHLVQLQQDCKQQMCQVSG